VLHQRGKYDEAEMLTRQTLELHQEVVGHEHPDTLMSVSLLAAILASQYQYDESGLLYERACAGYDIALGQNHPTTHACRKAYSEMLASRAQQLLVPSASAQSNVAELEAWQGLEPVTWTGSFDYQWLQSF
jgi:hypothetical protein